MSTQRPINKNAASIKSKRITFQKMLKDSNVQIYQGLSMNQRFVKEIKRIWTTNFFFKKN